MHPDQFRLWFTVDRPPLEGWHYSNGFIDYVMIQQHLHLNSKTDAVLMCGPPPMINFACMPALDQIGFPRENRFMF